MAQSAPAKKEREKQNIKVVARVRPMSKLEKEMQLRCIVRCVSPREIMTRDKKFHFDRVFKPETEQIEVYRHVVAPMIPDVIAGYNCTVFAYGQTGSGKTYTMTGDNCQCPLNWKEDPSAGCIPRAAAHIFEELQLAKSENNVKVSYLELYNEELRDLLSDDDSLLAIYNDTKGSIFVQGLREVSVHDSDGLCKQLQKGILKRQTAPTLMNHQSSRSHTVFTITVHTRESAISGEDILKTGKLNLVDLAGSENIARSGCKDVRAVELANINKSLLTLGRVIHALAEKGQRHVPYRDSKLTRILQDSLGGHTKTCIIATIAPAATAYEETVSTLEYASRARDIKNTPTINEKLTKTQMIQGLINEIDRLQKDLDAARDKSGFFIDGDNYQKLLDTIELVTGEKMTMEDFNRKQAKRIGELEEIVRTRTKEFDDTMEECKSRQHLLEEANEVIKKKQDILKEEQFVARVYETELCQMHRQAEQLLSTTKVLSVERSVLQDKLQKQYNINITNQTTSQSAVSQVLEMLKEISQEDEKFKMSDKNTRRLCKEDLKDLKIELQRPLSEIKKLLEFFEVQCTEELSIGTETKNTMNECIGSIKKKTLDMSTMLACFFEELEQFSVDKVGPFVKELKTIFHDYTRTVCGLIEGLHNKLAAEDTIFNECIMELKQDLVAQRMQEELFFKQRMEMDTKILNKIKDIQDRLSERKYAEGGKQYLVNLIHENEKWNEQAEAAVENFKKTLSHELTTDAATKSAPKELLTDLVQFEDTVNTLLARFDESRQRSTSTRESIRTRMDEMSDILDTQINIVDSRFDFLMDDRDTFQQTFQDFVAKADQKLKNDFLQKIVPVRHEGDTPARRTIVLANTFERPAPREALISRFRAERPLSDIEDKENSAPDES